MNILYDERVDGVLPAVDLPGLLQALHDALPDLEVLHRAEDLKPYECDGLSAYRTVPLLVVLPERLEQVQTLLKLCHQRGVPVVARGAGTGLSGGALPLAKGILLVMARFNRILEVNPQGRFARVQPGVRNLAISQAAAPYGLYYAPDPSSQIACSIGGNVAENAGGVHCLKYGLTVHNLLKVDILTVEGECLTLGSDALDLGNVARQHHQHRCGAIGAEPVAFVRLEFFLLVQDLQIRQLRAQGLQQRALVDLWQRAVDAFIVENVHSRFTILRS